LLLIDSVNSLKPSLIVTVGTSATKLAQTNFTDIPIVFSSVMYPALSGFVESMAQPGKNTTGASLNIAVDVQFRTFHDIVPNLKKIGVLYSNNTAGLIKPAQAVAAKMGMSLTAVRVNEAKELPGALDSLTRTVEGIWSVADAELFTPQSTRYILLNTLRKGIPFMGFSRHVVESGALFALDFDYKAVGQQAGAIAARVIDGEPPGEISVSTVDVLWFHYNEKTAKHISVSIPSELIAVAKEVYR
jgi:putative ABC transport system substrate-binding protein